MKSIRFAAYGAPSTLRIEEKPDPIPGKGQVLVRIRAASLNAADLHVLSGTPFPVRFMAGFPKPRIPTLGADLAGTVEAKGPGSDRFAVGAEVFGDLSACGFGAFAEKACVPEKALAPKPAALTFEEAAATPMAAVTAWHGLVRHGRLKAGERLLVLGANGGVGSFAVQIAVALGAEVTASCRRAKLDAIGSLGAKQVVATEDLDPKRSKGSFDLILDAAAYRSVFSWSPALTERGRYVLAGGGNGPLTQALLLGPLVSAFGKKRFGSYLSTPVAASLEAVADLAARGKIRPLLGEILPIDRAVEAFEHLIARRGSGKIVLRMD